VNLVLGATGNNGSEVVRVLKSMQQPVRAIVRDPAKAKGLAGGGVEVVAGDLAEPASLGEGVRGRQLALPARAGRAEPRPKWSSTRCASRVPPASAAS
jgi:uncharacterized protein YbjT (DUF2867 family)